jgi:hypothetical protein
MKSDLLQTAILIAGLALVTHGLCGWSTSLARVVLGVLLLTGLIWTRLRTNSPPADVE